jgi:hypothetical protein
MKIKCVILFTITITLTSCFGLFDSSADKIISDYEVGWIDIEESRNLSKQEELISSYVYAVGHNSKFIIAKQHPRADRDSPIDTKETNYFIIPIKKKNEYQDKKSVFGPLKDIQFDSLLKALNVGQIEFDMFYPENP